jgi:cephalosporin hydroxylase
MERFLLVDGVIAAQTPNIEIAFNQILKSFDLIIEIGFHRGGFTLWLFRNKAEHTKLVSYDISSDAKEVNNDHIDFRIGDCFDPAIIKEIQKLINSHGKVLLLCDGGNKIKEFNLYSALLKSGDVIMCHDYAHDETEYQSIISSINWETIFESDLKSILPAIKSNNLLPYNYDLFKNVLWGSFIKR